MNQYLLTAPIPVQIESQPDDSSCGPTALQAVYAYLGTSLALADIRSSLTEFETGGTLAVSLGIHALQQGYSAELLSYNLRIFDPTWVSLSSADLYKKLEKQARAKGGKKFQHASAQYMKFIELGGTMLFEDLSSALLDQYFNSDLPVLAGLSSTFLYGAMREREKGANQLVDDDIRGEPTGHFVVLCGRDGDTIYVADPFARNPLGEEHYYIVNANHLFYSILLGIVTYDANLLVVLPKERR